MLRNANNPSNSLVSLSVCRVNFLEIDLLPKMEPEKGTYIRRRPSKDSHRHSLNGLIIGVIENIGSVAQTEQPGIGWNTSPIHYLVGSVLKNLPTTFSRVLVLHARFTLPTWDAKDP